MNIFFLDGDPEVCAKMHCDKHVVKMIVESAQILSAAHFKSPNPKNKEWFHHCYQAPKGGNQKPLEWVLESQANYIWLTALAQSLIKEYKFRYFNRDHKAESVINWLTTHLPILPNKAMTKPSLSIDETPTYDPDHCEKLYIDIPCINNQLFLNEIIFYRRYYMQYKRHIAKWNKRPKPNWYK